MIVKILGLKISLELIILMLVIYLIMIVHALSSCCNADAINEGFKIKNLGKQIDKTLNKQNKNKKKI
jgi:hypothetical protein